MGSDPGILFIQKSNLNNHHSIDNEERIDHSVSTPFQGLDFFGAHTQCDALGWHKLGRWPWWVSVIWLGWRSHF
jgi:hypothetical protein